MANIEVITQINDLLDANDVTIAKTALGVLGAAVKGTGDIINADISATAAINVSKLTSSSATAGFVLTSSGTAAAPTFQAVSGSGTGDVVGPASATDNAIARFDTGTGKLLQTSAITVSDAGAITAPSVGSIIPFYFADQTAFPSATTYHGAVAHSHADAAMYYAHGGAWVKMLDTADTSINGGVNKIPKFDANGDLWFSGTATATGDALAIGGVFFQDTERLWFLNQNRSDGGSIFFNQNHDVNGGELQINSQNRMALCLGSNGALQLGLASGTPANNMQFVYLQQRGAATAGATLVNSLPLYFQPAYWNGTQNAVGLAGSIQAVASDLSGNSTFDFSIRAVQPSGAGTSGTRPLDMQISANGVWEVGKAPAWDILTDASTVTQTCSIYKTVQAAKLTLSSASRTLAISGAVAGMRGVIYVKQSGVGSFSLTLPTNSAKVSSFALSTTAGLTDRLQWEYDGSYYFWTISNAIEVPLDADVAIFVDAGRANITNTTQKDALNNLVTSLKASNVATTGTLWSKFSVLYPFVGGNATAHSRNLKSTSYDITWNGVTHNANGITGDDTAAYGDTNFNMAVLAQDSASIYAYCRTTTPTTTGKYLMGGHNGTTSRTAMLANTVSGNLDYSLNTTADASTGAGNDFSNHLAINRSATGTNGIQTYVGATRALATSTSVAPWVGDMYLLARNNNNTASSFTSANLAFVAYGSSLVEAEWTAFRAIIDTFQTALSRANA